MNSPSYEVFGLDDAVKMAAGNGGGRLALQLALHATFDAQQDPARHQGLCRPGKFRGQYLAGVMQPYSRSDQ